MPVEAPPPPPPPPPPRAPKPSRAEGRARARAAAAARRADAAERAASKAGAAEAAGAAAARPRPAAAKAARTATSRQPGRHRARAATDSLRAEAEALGADVVVYALLRSLDLVRLAPLFVENEVDAACLSLFGESDFAEMGASSADARRVVAEIRRHNGFYAAHADGAAVPDTFCCPISCEVMRVPVIAADGHTYERSCIEAWLARGKLTSPVTNEALANDALIPNHALRSLIADFTA